MGVPLVDHLLNGGRDEDVAVLVHQVLAGVRLGSREADDGAVFDLVVLQFLGVDAFGVEDGAVDLLDADASGSGTVEVPHRVETHVTKTLDDDSLATHAGGRPDHGHVGRLVEEVLQAVEDTATGGGHTAVDTSLVDGLARNAGVAVDVVVTDGRGISVRNPGHLALARSHVRSRDVDTRACTKTLRVND